MFAKSSQNVINIINRVTAFVVVLGAAALFIVLAGFAGLKHFTLSFSSTFDPDLKILPAKGKYLSLTSQDTLKLQQISQVAHFTKVLEEQVFLTHNQKNHIAYIKGVDEQYPKVNEIDSIIVLGNWEVTPPSVVVGGTIFNKLGLNLTDASSPLQIVVPKAGKGSILNDPMPYRQAFSVVQGIYQLTEDLDKKYVFSSLDEARFLLGVTPDKVSAIEVKLVPQADEKIATEAIAHAFEQPVIVKNRVQLNDALYRMLNTENIAVYLIFILVLIIALFNLVGAIIMMILDKKDDLQTLYALGMNQRQMRQIFFWQGTMASVVGATIGIALGALIVWLQQQFSLVMISPTLAYPVAITPMNTLIVLVTIVVLGLLASLVASSRVKNRMK
ncbi:FtsX-like permease family protein [Capnocytophaga leadbetteri]|uniref:ABC transporter permease n=1 Tax=Capnocytophaga leadbetteri TaxID=327575 RepID=UPI0028E91079|nr:FtsX-like permease family protein [Capnocytophaga leadbetteri]